MQCFRTRTRNGGGSETRLEPEGRAGEIKKSRCTDGPQGALLLSRCFPIQADT